MSGCGSSRPVPPARRKASFQQTTWPSRLVRATRRATQGRAGQGRAGQSRAGQGRAGGRAGREAPRPCNSPAWAPKTPLGVPPRPPKKAQTTPTGKSFAGRPHYSPRVPGLHSLTVLSVHSAGGLGRSLERPCKWSAALSAVSGLRV